MKRILTIAGSDSGGGAGIQADLKTITLLGAFGMSALTALTAQNTVAVEAIHEIPLEFIAAQIDAVFSDIGVDAVKTGMLANAQVVQLVADKIAEHKPPLLVVDPVMVAKSGAPLLAADARETLVRSLLPLATLVTPNLPEASALVRREIGNEDEMRRLHQGPERGDQVFIARKLLAAGYKIDYVRDIVNAISYRWQVASKHYHDENGDWCRTPDSRYELPADADIVCFHGGPRPHEIGWKL